MPRPETPYTTPRLSGFMLIRQRRKLLVEKKATDARVRELTRVRDDARVKSAVSGKGWDKERMALGLAERGLISINKTVMRIEKELWHIQS